MGNQEALEKGVLLESLEMLVLVEDQDQLDQLVSQASRD